MSVEIISAIDVLFKHARLYATDWWSGDLAARKRMQRLQKSVEDVLRPVVDVLNQYVAPDADDRKFVLTAFPRRHYNGRKPYIEIVIGHFTENEEMAYRWFSTVGRHKWYSEEHGVEWEIVVGNSYAMAVQENEGGNGALNFGGYRYDDIEKRLHYINSMDLEHDLDLFPSGCLHGKPYHSEDINIPLESIFSFFDLATQSGLKTVGDFKREVNFARLNADIPQRYLTMKFGPGGTGLG